MTAATTSPIRVSAPVRAALDEGRPVVALESTIFTHGLPRPRNLEVALEGEEIARSHGAVPATIGVFRGEPVVGLSKAEIEELSGSEGLLKASVRELAYARVHDLSAGTTIAATSFLASRVGIDVFATGGLGGVHHGAATTFDESADLVALSRTSFILVSSGAKAILDIRATLERFETLSVPVVGYRTTAYPSTSGWTPPSRPRRCSAPNALWESPPASTWPTPCPSTSSSTLRTSTRSFNAHGLKPTATASPARPSPPTSWTTCAWPPATAAWTRMSPSTATTSRSPPMWPAL